MEEYFKLIVTECIGCAHRTPDDHCDRYREPGIQWTRILGCAARTHHRTKQVASEKFVNPIKMSKRLMGVIPK